MSDGLDVIFSRHPGLREAQAVMLCGISGSGKTHFALSLEKAGFTRLSLDRLIGETYGKEFQSLSGEEQWRLTAEAERRIAEKGCEASRKGEKVVIDGCLCKRAKRDSMREALRLAGVEPRLVYLKADFGTSLRRLEAREGKGYDDIRITGAMLQRFFRGFQPPDDDEQAIVIDTSE